METDKHYGDKMQSSCFVGALHTKSWMSTPGRWVTGTLRCERHALPTSKVGARSVRQCSQAWVMASGTADADGTKGGSRQGVDETSRSAQTSASAPAPSEASATEATSGFQTEKDDGKKDSADKADDDEAKYSDGADMFEDEVPGKIVLSEQELAEQKKALERYAELLREDRLRSEAEASRLFGFVRFAETLNGRLAMFFFVTGLLTEYWTDYSIPQQIELLLRTLGVI